MLCQTLSMQLARKMLVLNPKGEDVLCHHHKDIAHQVLLWMVEQQQCEWHQDVTLGAA